MYTKMSTENLNECIADLEKTIKLNEQYGNKTTLMNAMYYHERACDELEGRQIKETMQGVNDFMEHQANMRDHEYELETMHEWRLQS